MNGELMFRAVGLVDDDLVEAAESYRRPHTGRQWVRVGALAACALLVVGSLWVTSNFLRLGGATSGAAGAGDKGLLGDIAGEAAPAPGAAPDQENGASTFMRYTGPVFPLNAEGDLDGITAERETAYTVGANADQSVGVTDHYTLRNATDEDKTLTLFYPYAASLGADAEHTPSVTMDGGSLDTELLVGDYAGGFQGAGEGSESLNLKRPQSWKDYKALLESGDYLAAAQGAAVWPDSPVTVYTFRDAVAPEGMDAATLAIEFTLPEGSHVLTWGMNGMSVDGETGWYQFSYFIGSGDTAPMIIILGTPPKEYSVAGYHNGACDGVEPEVTGRVERSDSTLYEAVQKGLDTREAQDMAMQVPLSGEERLQAVLGFLQYTELGKNPVERYDWIMLEDIASEAFHVERVLYRTAEVTVPAGGSVELTAAYRKDASHDFEHASAETKGVQGYDLVTTLGSALSFTSQRASLDLSPEWEIIRQNYGFDVPGGITEVELDPSREQYFFEVKRVEE